MELVQYHLMLTWTAEKYACGECDMKRWHWDKCKTAFDWANCIKPTWIQAAVPPEASFWVFQLNLQWVDLHHIHLNTTDKLYTEYRMWAEVACACSNHVLTVCKHNCTSCEKWSLVYLLWIWLLRIKLKFIFLQNWNIHCQKVLIGQLIF